jgi:hypothetical protein
VAENAANGTTVGITAVAVDPDVIDNVSYTLTNDAGGRFAIHANTGVVTVANGTLLNYEAATSHTITVMSTSSDGSSSTRTFTIDLIDQNEFGIGAITDVNASPNTMAENAANGSFVGITAHASDADASNNTISYTLSDSAGGRFAIDASTGVVTVADGSLLDCEVAASHNITVQATSADGSTSTQSLTIQLSDVNEFQVSTPRDTDAAANSVAENSANGSSIGVTAVATDLDATNNTITYTLSDSAGGRFAIDATTGIITVANGSQLDHESATSHTIMVMAWSSDGSTASQTITIQVEPVNDNAPTLWAAGGQDPSHITMQEATTGVMNLSAADADSPASALTFGIAGGADASLFTLDPSTGALSFKAPPSQSQPSDVNQDNLYDVVVQVSDGLFVTQLPLNVFVTPAPLAPTPEPVVTITAPLPPIVLPTLEDPVAPPRDEPEVIELDNAPTAPDKEAAAPAPSAANKPTSSATTQTATAAEAANGLQVGLTPTFRQITFELDRQIDHRAPAQWLTRQELDAFPQNPGINIQLANIPAYAGPQQALLSIPSSRLDAPGRPTPVFAPNSQDETSVILTSVSTAIETGGLTLSLGVIWWATRASSLLTSLIITTPAWRTMDPLPILFNEDPDDTASSGAPTSSDALAERMFGSDAPKLDEVAEIG